MLSGALAGKTVVEALEKDDVSKNALWMYNCRYMKSYGTKQAGLDVFRMFLIASKDEELNYGMSCRLLTEDDVLKAGLGDDFHLKITETSRRVFRGLKKIGFLNKLRLTVKMMRKVKAHYADYPKSLEDFEQWKQQTERIFEEAKSKIM
jgi:flavin-dependent dehydrogenase